MTVKANLSWLRRLPAVLLLLTLAVVARAQGAPSPLHVEGPFLVNVEGRRVNMHGWAQTFSPWFNERGTQWTNYDVAGCLRYNKGIIDGILAAGWQMTFVRQHMDPYWSNTPGVYGIQENDISHFEWSRFTRYLDEVFVPMAQYAVSKGLYVVMRPPGVCPETIEIGDAYHQYLKRVWDYVAQHPLLRDNGAILFELANEPVHINNGTLARDEAMTQYMQEIVDVVRSHCSNVVLVPGLGWQSNYAGFAKYPIKGDNIGYAVHCYPGWYNGGHGDDDVTVNYGDFKRGWDAQIMPVAVTNPIVVTEMDWAPSKYNSSWGKSNTGTAGQQGFGANFMRIADETCNVSWLLFTDGNLLARYNDSAPDGNTFLTDPEACPRPVYRRYLYYATTEYGELINQPDYKPQVEEQPLFSLTNKWFNPNIWEQGTFDEQTGCLVTGKYGFGGWQYPEGVDLSAYRYLVVELSQPQTVGASFRLFDVNNYWSAPYRVSFGTATKVVIDLHAMRAYKDDQCTQFDHDVDPSHIYIAGFWTYGGTPIYINKVYLSNDGETAGISSPHDGALSGACAEVKVLYALPGVDIVKVTDSRGKTQTVKVCNKR